MPELSNKIIHRLTLYHCILKHTLTKQLTISSFEIADLLNLDDSQVRKDIALCGVPGHKKQGYNIDELKSAIEKKLGFQKQKQAFIVGAGNLGCALANYSDFKDYGINVVALFDNNPQKVGQTVNGKNVFNLDELKKHISSSHVKNIILTVPAQYAQSVSDYAVSCGIQCIWNFTPTVLKVPKHVNVYYENIISSFLQMRNNFT